MPSLLKGKDLRNSISRLQFAALAVQLYETTTGQTVSVPQENPFSDTSDPQALKAYALGVTSGTGNGCFSPSRTITREQAAVMLCAVYRAAGGTISDPSTDRFTDHSSISSWARDSVYFLSHQGVLAGPLGIFRKPGIPRLIGQGIGLAQAHRAKERRTPQPACAGIVIFQHHRHGISHKGRICKPLGVHRLGGGNHRVKGWRQIFRAAALSLDQQRLLPFGRRHRLAAGRPGQ